MRGQAGFWDIDERYVRLSEAGDPLEKLNAVVPWEVFRKPLAKALKRSDGAKGGRPPYDPVLMFKILVLQALYSLSDDQAEFQIQDRLSFMRFLGLGLGDRVPDAKTIWLFREHLSAGPGGREPVRPFRQAPHQGRLSGDGRADRRRDDRGGAEAAQHRRREGRHQGGQGPGGVEGEAGQAEAEGSRRALDGEVLQGQGGRGRESRSSATSPFRPSATRTMPRSTAGTASSAAGPSPAPRPMTGRSSATCSIASNTGSTVWADTAYRSKKNEAWLEKNGYVSDIHHKKPKGRPMSERTVAGQWPPLQDPRLRRACLRAAESPHGPVRAHHRHRAGQDEDRHGQPRLQPHALRLAPGANCARMTAKAAKTAAADAEIFSLLHVQRLTHVLWTCALVCFPDAENRCALGRVTRAASS